MNQASVRAAVTRVAYSALPAVAALGVLLSVGLAAEPARRLAAFAAEPSVATLPPDWWWAVVPFAAAMAAMVGILPATKHRLVAVVSVIVVTGVTSMLDWNRAYHGWILMPVGVAVLALAQRAGKIRLPLVAVSGALLTVVLGVGSYFRFRVLPGAALQALDPDADAFLRIAENSVIWNTTSREPLFIWLIKGMRLVSGDYSPEALRLFGIGLSLFTIVALFHFARRHVGLLAATVAGLLYAAAPAFVFSASRGLREDLVIAMFLIFCSLLLRTWNRLPRSRDYAFLGLALALNIGLRMSTLSVGVLALGLLFGWSLWRHHATWRQVWQPAMALAIAVAPYVPYFVYSHRAYGDAFYCVNIIPHFYANLEFAGTPGFPTREEFKANAFAGQPVSMGKYVFGMHAPSVVAERTMHGAWRLYFSKQWQDFPTVSAPWWTRYGPEYMFHFGDFNLGRQPLARPMEGQIVGYLWLQTLGLIALLFPGRRLFLFLVFIYHAPGLFLVSLPVFDWRLVTLALASFYVGIGAAAQTGFDLSIRGVRAALAPDTDEQTPTLQTAQIQPRAKKPKVRRG